MGLLEEGPCAGHTRRTAFGEFVPFEDFVSASVLAVDEEAASSGVRGSEQLGWENAEMEKVLVGLGSHTARPYLALPWGRWARYDTTYSGNMAFAAAAAVDVVGEEHTAESLFHGHLEDMRHDYRWDPYHYLPFRCVTTGKTHVSDGLAAYEASVMQRACQTLPVASSTSIHTKEHQRMRPTERPSPPILPKLKPFPWP